MDIEQSDQGSPDIRAASATADLAMSYLGLSELSKREAERGDLASAERAEEFAKATSHNSVAPEAARTRAHDRDDEVPDQETADTGDPAHVRLRKRETWWTPVQCAARRDQEEDILALCTLQLAGDQTRPIGLPIMPDA